MVVTYFVDSFKVRAGGERREVVGEVLGGERKKENNKGEAQHPAPSVSSLSLLSHYENKLSLHRFFLSCLLQYSFFSPLSPSISLPLCLLLTRS